MATKLDKSNKESFWQAALKRTKQAVKSDSLQPLETEIIKIYNDDLQNFEVRKLVAEKPPHLINETHRKNPFLPPDKELEIANIGKDHILILNKYPVQVGHMLLITKDWAPQNGWLSINDFRALEIVSEDTQGLWFFNSSSTSGASQAHRHLQLLRRDSKEQVCPRAKWFDNQLTNNVQTKDNISKGTHVIALGSKSFNSKFLYKSYLDCCLKMEVGTPSNDKIPRKAYNLILSKDWFIIVVRSKEKIKGFSINALGFAGYLLATEDSDISWLECNGPISLLEEVVQPVK